MIMRNPYGVDRRRSWGILQLVGPSWEDNTHGRLCHFKEVTSWKQNGQRQDVSGPAGVAESSRVCCSGRPFLRALRCKKSGSLSLLSLLSGLVWV